MPCVRGRRTSLVSVYLAVFFSVKEVRRGRVLRRPGDCAPVNATPSTGAKCNCERDRVIGCNATLFPGAPASISQRHCPNQHGGCSMAVTHDESLSPSILTASRRSDLQQTDTATWVELSQIYNRQTQLLGWS